MPIDIKKSEKELYQPKTTPSIVDVTEMFFIAVDGKGDPNTSEAYKTALEILYGLSYSIKMSKMSGKAPIGFFDYVVAPLEGLWNVADDYFKGNGAALTVKSGFEWTAMIRQPEFVTPDVFEEAKRTLVKKKPELDLSKARLMSMTEGLCVHVMHIGPYDEEPATIAEMERFAEDNGYAIEINESRRHHEIYLTDPRKTASQKLRTVIRHPIRSKAL